MLGKGRSYSAPVLAPLADANTSDRQEAVAADCDIPGKSH
jgi:hypothetical protein